MKFANRKLKALFTGAALATSAVAFVATEATANGFNDGSSTFQGRADIQRDRTRRAETRNLAAGARNAELTAITNQYFNANDDIILGDFAASGDFNAGEASLNTGITAEQYVESNGSKVVNSGDNNSITTNQDDLSTGAAAARGNDGVHAGGSSNNKSAEGDGHYNYASDRFDNSTSEFHDNRTGNSPYGNPTWCGLDCR